MTDSKAILYAIKEEDIAAQPPESEFGAAMRRLLRDRKGAIGTAILGLMILMAIFGPFLTPYDPIGLHLDHRLEAPSGQFWFGTDELGRDIFSRVVHGASVSLQAGVMAVALAAAVGMITGLLAGYLGGWTDAITMRILDTLLAFPSIFLALSIVTVLGPGYYNAVIAVGLISTPTFARLVRGQVLAVKQKEFVTAACAIGCSDGRIMLRHVLPNCLTPVMVNMAIAAPAAILVEAALSYLGMGSQPPSPSWGNMLQASQEYLRRSWTYGIFPGAAITLVVLGMNFFADALQDTLDPRRIHAGSGMV